MQIKSTVRFLLATLKTAIIQNSKTVNADEDMGEKAQQSPLKGEEASTIIANAVWRFLGYLNIDLPYDPSILS